MTWRKVLTWEIPDRPEPGTPYRMTSNKDFLRSIGMIPRDIQEIAGQVITVTEVRPDMEFVFGTPGRMQGVIVIEHKAQGIVSAWYFPLQGWHDYLEIP